MPHFESIRTDTTHNDKFKDKNDTFYEYKDQHGIFVQV